MLNLSPRASDCRQGNGSEFTNSDLVFTILRYRMSYTLAVEFPCSSDSFLQCRSSTRLGSPYNSRPQRFMFPNFLHLFSRKTPSDYEEAFVQHVQVTRKVERNPQIERLLWFGWILILLKSILVWWACSHYPVPFHPLWIILPSFAFATLCTAIYLSRR